MSTYNFKAFEKKWQIYWDENKIFSVSEDETKQNKKYYVLEMFPYPSGRLHMGHVRNYTIADVIARHRRMQGLHVLHPIGWDSFGLPAENAAIKSKDDPEKWTISNINAMRGQLKSMGISYDWSREFATCMPDYYKWNQWLFLKFYKKGLVYRKESNVNWCPSCATVLANEQAEEGVCWRCDTDVEQRDLEQWFFKITAYQEQLLKDHDLIRGKWADRILSMQENWIGKSTGTCIDFPVDGMDETMRVFTTRPDTLFGVTYVVLAPEHPLVQKLVQGKEQENKVCAFIDKVAKQTELDRKTQTKEGVFTGGYVVHPLTGEKIPIWVGNYVLFSYGTGAVMAVPSHDQRDFDFAKEYDLPIKWVIGHKDGTVLPDTEAYEDEGVLMNSEEFSTLSSQDAKSAITKKLKEKNRGFAEEQYRLRDWLISRQRYWGTPIPMIYCRNCGMVPVPEKDLPVLLPKNVKLSGQSESPLKHHEEFVHVECPKCGNRAHRETDTMDTFVDSSWYFLRYCDAHNDGEAFDKNKADYWMPVDQYIGGAEHACMHLLYSRFFSKVFVDMGLISSKSNEPFTRLLNQGMVIKDGAKMSKSKGNIVDPDDMLKKYGTDVLRLFVLFASPPHKDLEWSEDGIEGMSRFLNRFWRLAKEAIDGQHKKDSVENMNQNIEHMLHQTIKRITIDMETFSYNTAIAAVMECVNFLYKVKDSSSKQDIVRCITKLVIMLSPFVPHMSEELWQRLGNQASLSHVEWPVYDEKKTHATSIEFVVQVNGKVRGRFSVSSGITQEEAESLAYDDPKIKGFLAEKTIIKTIFVKNKLLNIVVR